MNFRRELVLLGMVGLVGAEMTVTPEGCDDCAVATAAAETPIPDAEGLKALVEGLKECSEECKVTVEGDLALTSACADATDIFAFDVSEVKDLELDFSKLTFPEELTCGDDAAGAKDLDDPCEPSDAGDVTVTVDGTSVTLDPATFEKNFQIKCTGIGKGATLPVSKNFAGAAAAPVVPPGEDGDDTDTTLEGDETTDEAQTTTGEGEESSTAGEHEDPDNKPTESSEDVPVIPGKGARSLIAATGTAAVILTASLL